MDESNSPESKKGSYGKRPLWQWIAIYLIVAVVVYGIIYLLFIRGNGSSGY